MSVIYPWTPKVGMPVEYDGHVWHIWGQAPKNGEWWIARMDSKGNSITQAVRKTKLTPKR